MSQVSQHVSPCQYKEVNVNTWKHGSVPVILSGSAVMMNLSVIMHVSYSSMWAHLRLYDQSYFMLDLFSCNHPSLFLRTRHKVRRYPVRKLSASDWSETLKRHPGGWQWLIRISADSPMSWMLPRTTTWIQAVCSKDQQFVSYKSLPVLMGLWTDILLNNMQGFVFSLHKLLYWVFVRTIHNGIRYLWMILFTPAAPLLSLTCCWSVDL